MLVASAGLNVDAVHFFICTKNVIFFIKMYLVAIDTTKKQCLSNCKSCVGNNKLCFDIDRFE